MAVLLDTLLVRLLLLPVALRLLCGRTGWVPLRSIDCFPPFEFVMRTRGC